MTSSVSSQLPLPITDVNVCTHTRCMHRLAIRHGTPSLSLLAPLVIRNCIWPPQAILSHKNLVIIIVSDVTFFLFTTRAITIDQKRKGEESKTNFFVLLRDLPPSHSGRMNLHSIVVLLAASLSLSFVIIGTILFCRFGEVTKKKGWNERRMLISEHTH